MLTYLIVNLAAVAVPFAYTFHRRLRFDLTWRAFWPAALLTAGAFILWDHVYTRLGVWGFNPKYLLGVNLLGLPVEEWLFFVCIPYACVFTYHCLNRLIERDYFAPLAGTITWVLIAGFMLVAAFNWQKLYTGVTFFVTAAFLFVHLFVFKSAYLGRFYFAYVVLLAPFLLVNGILTGSFIDQEVVWYSNAENLGLRIGTIPIEDFVYALLLILMNVTIYEAILAKVESQWSAMIRRTEGQRLQTEFRSNGKI